MLIREVAFEAGLRMMDETVRDKDGKTGFRGVKEKSEGRLKA